NPLMRGSTSTPAARKMAGDHALQIVPAAIALHARASQKCRANLKTDATAELVVEIMEIGARFFGQSLRQTLRFVFCPTPRRSIMWLRKSSRLQSHIPFLLWRVCSWKNRNATTSG